MSFGDILASAFHSIDDHRAVKSLANLIKESLILQIDKFRNIIHFANGIMTNIMHIRGEQNLRYNMKIWNKNYVFDIINNISEYVTLVQLIYSPVNVNHAISIVGYWIFDSNYEKPLLMKK